jgi:hypothetical protein
VGSAADGNQVYANGMEIACKAAAGKSIAAFPDTCLPAIAMAGRYLPIPAPRRQRHHQRQHDGVISSREVMLKDQLTFKSIGDEAATILWDGRRH